MSLIASWSLNGTMCGYPPGSPHLIENRHGILDCRNTTISGFGTILTINWSFIPAPTLGGKTHSIYMLMENRQGNRDGWKQMGSWTIRQLRDVAIADLSPYLPQPRVNQPVTVSCMVTNLGSLPETNLTFRLLLNSRQIFVNRISRLNPKENWRGSTTVRFSNIGRHFLKAEVIPTTSETNTTNNALTREVIVRR